MPEFKSLAADGLTFSDAITCDAFARSEEDGLWDKCVRPSRYVVERSDGDRSFGAGGGTEESCEEHLVETVAGMVDGDEQVRAVVTIRWTGPEVEAVTGDG
jgi:hypothetical protein